MPDNRFLLDVIENFGKPIVATSLNLAGEESLTSLKNLSKRFKDNVDLIIDSGETKLKAASTIIKIEDDEIKILRKGPIKF